MYNLICADLFKLSKSIAIKVLFGITTISALTITLMAYLIPQGKLGENMIGMGFMLSDISMMSILGPVLAGLLICGDFDNKTIQDAIANGCSKGSIIVSKTITFCCALTFILMPYAVITGIGIATGSEFGMGKVAIAFLNILTSDAGTAYSAPEILKLLAVFLTMIIVYWAQLSICLPIAIVLRKPILLVPIYYVFSVLSAQLIRFRDSSPTFKVIFDGTPYGGNYSFITLETGTADIFKAITVSLIFIVLMMLITYALFKKSEVK